MIVLAMPRIENEMPYGSGVVHGEEYVTTSFVTVQHRDYTVYQFVGKQTMFLDGLEMDFYFAMGRSGDTRLRMTGCMRTDHPAECKCDNSTVRNIYIL